MEGGLNREVFSQVTMGPGLPPDQRGRHYRIIVGNNPVNFVDPSGLDALWPGDYDYTKLVPRPAPGASVSDTIYYLLSYIHTESKFFDCFANCIQKERFDPYATLGGLVGALGFGSMPKVGRELITFRGTPKNPDITGEISRWGGRIGRLLKKPGLTREIRDIGRSVAGKAIGAAATGFLVFEGFYDIGAIGRCAEVCLSDSCSY